MTLLLVMLALIGGSWLTAKTLTAYGYRWYGPVILAVGLLLTVLAVGGILRMGLK